MIYFLLLSKAKPQNLKKKKKTKKTQNRSKNQINRIISN